MKEKKRTIQKQLEVKLTEEETLKYSRELAKVNQDLASEEEKKKEIMSDIANKINSFKTNITVLSRKISNGYEYRTVDVDVLFDYKKGMKYFVRRDTKETINEQVMTDEDRQQELDFKKAEKEKKGRKASRQQDGKAVPENKKEEKKEDKK